MATESHKSDDLHRLADAAARAGVTVNQLRYYLYAGVVRATRRSPAGQRLFDRRAIRKVKMVALLNRSGYTLRDIREIFVGSDE